MVGNPALFFSLGPDRHSYPACLPPSTFLVSFFRVGDGDVERDLDDALSLLYALPRLKVFKQDFPFLPTKIRSFWFFICGHKRH